MEAFQSRSVLFAKGAGTAGLKALLTLPQVTARAHIDYRITGQVRCPIHLIKARDNPPQSTEHRPAYGWAEWSEQGVIVEEMPGPI